MEGENPPHDTILDVDVMTVEWYETLVGKSGTVLLHLCCPSQEVRNSTEEVWLRSELDPPRTRRGTQN
jgi:hypothetical protein